MDPITAGLNAFKEFCALMQTPPGQVIMTDATNAMHGAVAGIFNFFHSHFSKATNAQSTNTESNSPTPAK